MDKFSLEKSLMELINPETISDIQIIEILQKSITEIFSICRDIITLFKNKTIKNRKQMEKRIQELLGDKIVYNVEVMDSILKSHFDFIPQVFLIGF